MTTRLLRCTRLLTAADLGEVTIARARLIDDATILAAARALDDAVPKVDDEVSIERNGAYSHVAVTLRWDVQVAVGEDAS